MASQASFGAANAGFQANTINGPVHTAFHLPPHLPETSPSPSIVIPFGRDKDFVERGTLLGDIEQKFAVPGSRTALLGLGGVGKSQLAIEHAYRTRDQSPETWVFWVHASNLARFEQSFRDIADRTKIPGRRDANTNIVKLVHDWLYDINTKWLLILDNVDDARFLLEVQGAAKPLREYIPHCEHGSVLVTTRNREAALKIVERRDVIAVDPMDKIEALALFEKKLGVPENSGDTAELVEALEYMPLAIAQAAAYILKREHRYSVKKYLSDFNKGERKRSNLLAHDDGQLQRDWEASNSIIVTWQISFEYIQHARPSAADLLSLMSFFDRQGIPEDLLRRRPEHGGQKVNTNSEQHSDDDDSASQSSTDDDDFELDVVTLRSFCFISTDTNETGFEMHGLVQLATRQWLAANNKLERYKETFISNLCEAFPTGHYKNWPVCRTLFAHAKAALNQQPEEEASLVKWAKLLYNAAIYAGNTSNSTDAITLGVKSMETWKTMLGFDHENTLSSAMTIAIAYTNSGQWKKAEELCMQSVDICTGSELGLDHPLLPMCMHELASSYIKQERWDEAGELLTQIVQTCTKKFGIDDYRTIRGMGNLSWTKLHTGQLKIAEELQVQVTEYFKTRSAVYHPETLRATNILAGIYRKQERMEAAIELYLQVVETSKKILGENHENTFSYMRNLGSIYAELRRFEEAEELLLQVIEGYKKHFGVDHQNIIAATRDLAWTYYQQGRWKKAEGLYLQMIEDYKKHYVVDHPGLLDATHNLASTYYKQGQLEMAEELFLQVIEGQKKRFRVDHPDLIRAMHDLALTYYKQGQLEMPEELQTQVLGTRKKTVGLDNEETLRIMAQLALTWRGQGRRSEAFEQMRDLVQRGQRIFKPDDAVFLFYSTKLSKWEAEDVNVAMDCIS